jgi:amidohydrolase
MNELKRRILELSDNYFEEIRSVRRHLHAHPELSFQEFNTAQFIEEQLALIGIQHVTRIAKTGVTAVIEGDKKGSTIALRADIDALPIREENNIDYKSQNTGVMHACGHDVHTASLLGTAKILHQLKSELQGTVKLIFQPGEEKLPGGASILIKEGILENPTPKKIVGQHVMPLIPAGKVGFRKGEYMASADEIYLNVIGKGGHAATPEYLVDPILIASHIITGLQQITSRNSSPKMPSVLSFGKIVGAGATNVIPDVVRLEGTFRTFDEKWRFDAHELIRRMSKGIAESMGGSCEVDIQIGYPFLHNDPDFTEKNIVYAREYLGDDNVVDLDLWMAGEDFAFYSQVIPASFYRLGTRNEAKNITSGVHTPTFDIDEDALKTSIGLMSWIAFRTLEQNN